MNYRPLGRTGSGVSDISFGAWATEGNWAHPSESAPAALNQAVER
jgi:aryl-alcohol dehydrogenase-like predicted oxidoreductase